MCVVAFLLNPLPILFLYQSYASLYEICQVLTLQHTIRQECQVDNLTYELILATNLCESSISLLTQRENLLRQLLAHLSLLGCEILLLLVAYCLVEATLLGYGCINLLCYAL